jgi:RHS repeat-associated protein
MAESSLSLDELVCKLMGDEHADVLTDRGDVVELLDANGTPFAAYRYDAWGNPTLTQTVATTLISSQLASDMATRQVLRYAGYAYDSESGLYYCSARSYDPATRQWISKDPEKADGEESAYQYCGEEPASTNALRTPLPNGPRVLRLRFRDASRQPNGLATTGRVGTRRVRQVRRCRKWSLEDHLHWPARHVRATRIHAESMSLL